MAINGIFKDMFNEQKREKELKFQKEIIRKTLEEQEYSVNDFDRGIELLNNEDYENAIIYLTRCANNDNSQAQYELGRLFKEGLGTEKNIVKAKEYLMKAYKNGFKRVEPTSSLVNWLQPKNTGYNIQIIRDDKKLIEAEPENQDKNLKSDFIPYGTIEGVERKDLKYNMPLENDFKAHNSPLYLEDMKKFKDDVFNDMVNRLVDKENTEIVKLYSLK